MRNGKTIAAMILLSGVILTLSSSCKKMSYEVSDSPFLIELKHIHSDAVFVDIIPESIDFHYYYDVVSEQDYARYPGDKALIDSTDACLKDIFAIMQEYVEGSFEDFWLRSGAIAEEYNGLTLLEPDTAYILYAYAYDENLVPLDKLTKVNFKTPAKKVSDISFSVTLQGSTIVVTPSNDDSYFFEYEAVEEVKSNYGDNPHFWFESIVSFYESYDFMDNFISRGTDSEDMSIYYDLAPGDGFYLFVTGYDNGLTSPEPSAYKLKYNGPDIAGTVETLVLENS